MNPQEPAPTTQAIPRSHSRDPGPVQMEELSKLSFFEGIGPHHLAELTAHTKFSYFEPGEALLSQGELANRFYVIVSGKAVIECHVGDRTFQVQECGPGDAVGFSWFFTPETLHFTVRAIEPVKAIFFYGTLLREDCDLEPALGYQLMLRTEKVLVGRMEALIRLLAAQCVAK